MYILFAVGGYNAPGQQQRYGSEVVEEENEKMADVLADKVKALKSVSHYLLLFILSARQFEMLCY